MNIQTPLGFSLVVLALLCGCDRSQAPSTPDSPTVGNSTTETPTGTVTLEIKSGGEIRSIEIENVADDATLESVMRSASDLDADISGSGLTAFVNQIDGQATSGTEGWTFSVDGEWSNQGIGTTKLHPPTKVTWEFGEMETPE